MSKGFRVINVDELTEESLPTQSGKGTIIVEYTGYACVVADAGRDNISITYEGVVASQSRKPIPKIIERIKNILA